ncbi:putative protein phosphatase Slingshot [Cricetulus griseus]|uniref:protein-serine/threonine phosphatase n=1 Tax=Cricetulus griseus TaxID=10029 RepID=A0A061I7N5_CRIGR|nr:putative protein phosphatase Slingshot [Cricetulus griseus]
MDPFHQEMLGQGPFKAKISEKDKGHESHLLFGLSESFFMVKGAALFLQQGNSPQGQRSLQHPHKHAGDLPQHLQVMINLLRCEDRIKLAVRLESVWTDRVRYMVVVYTSGRQDTEENILLGVDFSSKESKSCTIGMVLRLWSDTKIHLDGDGGFSVSTAGRMHIFKPVSVQAMWSALQVLHKACEVARRHNYFPGGVALIWATYYESCIGSEQSCINEWNAMQDLESTRPDSPALFVDKPTEGERTERLIKAKLRSIMMSQDLENVTSKEGSEWNASNLEELQGSGVDYILNVTREIDNFFPGLFAYHNIRVYDEETTDLLAHWNEAYHFINKAKRNHSKCLVHCKMGVSRSASTVIAYAMKEFGWPLEKAYNYVKQKRSITRPNAGFMRQLSEYEGILDASAPAFQNRPWPGKGDAVFGILSKVKPSYTSCADCMYPAAGGAPEAFVEWHEEPSAPAICTQPAFLPHVTSSPMAHTSSRSRAPERLASSPANNPASLLPAGSRKPDVGGSGAGAHPEPPASLLEPSRETSKVPPKSLLLKNSHCDKNATSMEVVKEELSAKRDPKPAKDLRLLFSNEAEKPTTNSYLMQHQESIIQLQKAGLVRKHTKELERLKSLPSDPPSTCRDSATSRLEASIPEEGQEPEHSALSNQAGIEEKPPEGALVKSPTPTLLRLDHTSSFSKDFLKTVCYTPTSSSMSSNLTRSSSSDSIHSVRGKPGLVKQRAQEIETRLRLAGLTVSSPLKRSHSLAKLGSLNLSTEDLSSEADTSTIADSQDANVHFISL